MFSFTSLNSVCVSLYLSIFFFSSSFSPLVLSNQNLSQHFICVLFRFTVPAPKQRLSWLKTIHLKIIIFPPLLQAQCSFLWLSIKLSISAATTIHLITVESHPFFFFFQGGDARETELRTPRRLSFLWKQRDLLAPEEFLFSSLKDIRNRDRS